ncbi:TPA: hypothetical protein N0F65_009981, partial [Lagenidium giganteum]
RRSMAHADLRTAVLAGVALRVVLYSQRTLQRTLSTRPELVTPMTSLHRVRESAYLFEHLGSPYAGDVFHQPPLVFAAFYPLMLLPEPLQYIACCALFIAVDVAIACGMARLCRSCHANEEGDVPRVNADEIWLHRIPVSPLFAPDRLPTVAALIYLFNPYSLASTMAMSTASLTHVAVLYSLVFAAEGRAFSSAMFIALGTYLSVYPFFFAVPVALMLKRPCSPSDAAAFPFAKLFSVVSFSLHIFIMLLMMSSELSGGWGFIQKTYLWVASYSDLTPNVGIFWYFFMEVFDRFIPYFLLLLHVHPLIYIVPIYLRLPHRPQAFACALVGILTLFQAYPSFGDFGFFLTMMSLHPKTVMTMENRYVYALGLAVATFLLPVMWFLWLFPASGNANFFYNQTLVYQIFNSQVITAFVGATMKRDKDIETFKQRARSTAGSEKKTQ